MNVAVSEVKDSIAVGTFKVSPANVPFIWNGPVQSRCSRRNLMNDEARQIFAEDGKRLPHSIARKGSADWEKPSCEVVHKTTFFAHTLSIH